MKHNKKYNTGRETQYIIHNHIKKYVHTTASITNNLYST